MYDGTKEYEQLKRMATAANSVESGQILIALEPNVADFIYEVLCEYLGIHDKKKEDVLRQSKEWLDRDNVSREAVAIFAMKCGEKR